MTSEWKLLSSSILALFSYRILVGRHCSWQFSSNGYGMSNLWPKDAYSYFCIFMVLVLCSSPAIETSQRSACTKAKEMSDDEIFTYALYINKTRISINDQWIIMSPNMNFVRTSLLAYQD